MFGEWGPYEAREQAQRLVLRIINPTNEPAVVIGERSYLVDPTGETLPVRGGTVGPGGHVTMRLPSEPPVLTRPRVGFGVGVGVGGGGHVGSAVYDPWRYGPPVVMVAEAPPHWRWVTGVVRSHLVYEHAGERYEHHLAFDRERMR